jgi:hypothetical protein
MIDHDLLGLGILLAMGLSACLAFTYVLAAHLRHHTAVIDLHARARMLRERQLARIRDRDLPGAEEVEGVDVVEGAA